MVAIAMQVVAATRSFQSAADLIRQVLGRGPSPKTLERLTHQIGQELGQVVPCETTSRHVVPPQVAVVSCDGGRIRTRRPGLGPGVHEPCWRESKCAAFERMHSLPSTDGDPCPRLPLTFRQPTQVADISDKRAFDVPEHTDDRPSYRGPKRILRTCLASLGDSRSFGRQMAQEARRRRFYEAHHRAFIGDGLAWNWTLWREHFSDFVPILDFIHAVQYLYAAAETLGTVDRLRWKHYLSMAQAVWQGDVEQVIADLKEALHRRGIDPHESLAEDHPSYALQAAARYLENNRQRMDYPRYRRMGLPITSAPMESLIKQINHRVKGTEMFWNSPEGAEAILQLRAASLCEDDRFADYLKHRRGCAFTRRRTLATAA